VFDQVQFETRLDVMEIHSLGRSLDPKRREQLEALYDGKSETFKDKASQSVAAGFESQWGVDPIFGKDVSGKVKRVLRDRYLVNSDRRALEIVYLGRALSAPQRIATDAFYAKLTPAQQQMYSQKADLEFDLMWGSEPPNAKVAGQIKWALRTQQMEKDFVAQVYRGSEQTQKTQQAHKPASAQELKQQFEQNLAANTQRLLKSNKDRLNREQTQYAQDHNPKSDRWQHLWQAEEKRRAFETQEHQMVDERMRLIEESNGLGTALDPLYDKPADTARKKQRAAYLESRKAFLSAQIEFARQQQVSLNYAYPALAAIKGETGEKS
jgi:hypothetical protein